jgi:uncharacterized SAM-binding protein YcdF (DUF218 family)
MFLLRKLVAPLLSPLSVVLGLTIVGLLLLWFSRRQKAGRMVVTIGTALLLVVSYGRPTEWLMRPLEFEHPTPLQMERMIGARPPRWIVVLGGGFTPDPRLPVTSQLGPGTLARLVEGVRLYKRFPGARLVVSGGVGFDSGPEARPMSEVAQLLGVPRADVVLEESSLDTEGQAREVASIVGDSEFFLVTSASHMPRAFALFQKQGLRPVAAAADYSVKESSGFGPSQLYPQAGHVHRAQRAVHEYLGLTWSWLRGTL